MVSENTLGNLYDVWTWGYKNDKASLPTENKLETKQRIGKVFADTAESLETMVPSDVDGRADLTLRVCMNGVSACWSYDKTGESFETIDFVSKVKEISLDAGFTREQGSALSKVMTDYIFKLGTDLSDEIKLVSNRRKKVYFKRNF